MTFESLLFGLGSVMAAVSAMGIIIAFGCPRGDNIACLATALMMTAAGLLAILLLLAVVWGWSEWVPSIVNQHIAHILYCSALAFGIVYSSAFAFQLAGGPLNVVRNHVQRVTLPAVNVHTNSNSVRPNARGRMTTDPTRNATLAVEWWMITLIATSMPHAEASTLPSLCNHSITVPESWQWVGPGPSQTVLAANELQANTNHTEWYVRSRCWPPIVAWPKYDPTAEWSAYERWLPEWMPIVVNQTCVSAILVQLLQTDQPYTERFLTFGNPYTDTTYSLFVMETDMRTCSGTFYARIRNNRTSLFPLPPFDPVGQDFSPSFCLPFNTTSAAKPITMDQPLMWAEITYPPLRSSLTLYWAIIPWQEAFYDHSWCIQDYYYLKPTDISVSAFLYWATEWENRANLAGMCWTLLTVIVSFGLMRNKHSKYPRLAVTMIVLLILFGAICFAVITPAIWWIYYTIAGSAFVWGLELLRLLISLMMPRDCPYELPLESRNYRYALLRWFTFWINVAVCFAVFVLQP